MALTYFAYVNGGSIAQHWSAQPKPPEDLIETLALAWGYAEIGFEATPDVIATQEVELDWTEPARLLGSVATPTLVLHGADDQPVPVELAESIVAAMQNARLEVIPGGGHRPDIRSPELVNPLLLEFLLAR